MRIDERPCPFCGSMAYVWGNLRAQALRFLSEDAGWMVATFGGGTMLRARRCEACGNVQMFDDAAFRIASEEALAARVFQVPGSVEDSVLPVDRQIERAKESLSLGILTTPIDAWLVEQIGEAGGFLTTGGTLYQWANAVSYRRFGAEEVRELAESLVGVIEVEVDSCRDEETRGLSILLIELIMGAAEAGDAILVELA